MSAVLGTATGILVGAAAFGTVSAASSRDTCVLLSKKSFQSSGSNCGINGTGILLDINFRGRDELAFDAGRAGSLKPDFRFACGFPFATDGVSFLTKLAGDPRPGIDGSSNPVCDVSRTMVGGV